jgi:hypothetical protein
LLIYVPDCIFATLSPFIAFGDVILLTNELFCVVAICVYVCCLLTLLLFGIKKFVQCTYCLDTNVFVVYLRELVLSLVDEGVVQLVLDAAILLHGLHSGSNTFSFTPVGSINSLTYCSFPCASSDFITQSSVTASPKLVLYVTNFLLFNIVG